MSTSPVTDDVEITDEELTALALAADPDESLDADAVPFESELRDEGSLLPAWYMPVPARFDRTGGRSVVALVIVGALLALNALGLCVTYGYLEIAH
jgi:hypothetical protein